jgi:hypothetical protein
MRNGLMIIAVIGALLSNGGGRAVQLTNSVAQRQDNAPIGHLQPRAAGFSSGTPVDQLEQQNISKFDAEQKKLGRKLDNELSICRC